MTTLFLLVIQIEMQNPFLLNHFMSIRGYYHRISRSNVRMLQRYYFTKEIFIKRITSFALLVVTFLTVHVLSYEISRFVSKNGGNKTTFFFRKSSIFSSRNIYQMNN